MPEPVSIFCFGQALRLADNPALNRAAAADSPLVFLYVLDQARSDRPLAGAALWRLGRALAALGDALAAQGARLLTFQGSAPDLCLRLAHALGAGRVYCPEGAVRGSPRDVFAASGVRLLAYDDNDPRPLSDGRYVGQYAAFRRLALEHPAAIGVSDRDLAPAPRLRAFEAAIDLAPELTPWPISARAPFWSRGFAPEAAGEAWAMRQWSAFRADGLAAYEHRRDELDGAGGSHLSTALRFGEIAFARLWTDTRKANMPGAAKFADELIWRAYCRHWLANHPEWRAPSRGEIAWRDAPEEFTAWTRGQTGYPVIDAAMRGLWRTGLMSNRARMLCASFLCKHLLVDWRCGEAWFWDCLLDADPAANPFNWRWSAGLGAVSQPFFRIFNPITQAAQFDCEGRFIRRFCPELAQLPPPFLFAPWTASPRVLEAAGVRLGRDYPFPIVEHQAARRRALDAFANRNAVW